MIGSFATNFKCQIPIIIDKKGFSIKKNLLRIKKCCSRPFETLKSYVYGI
jgi:hypothetical protein